MLFRARVAALLKGSPLPVLSSAFLASAWFLPVLRAPRAGSARALALVPTMAAIAGKTPLHVFRSLVAEYHAGHPGWFPTGAVPLLAWVLSPGFAAASAAQYFLIVASFAFFGYIAYRLYGRSVAIVATVLTLCAWQFRTPHDPVLNTDLVVAFSATLTFATISTWLAFERSRRGRLLFFFFPMLVATSLVGPVPDALCVVLLTALLVARRDPVVVSAAVLVFVASLANGAAMPSPRPDFHVGVYVHDVISQFLAAVPPIYRSTGHLPIGGRPSIFTHTSLGWRFINNDFSMIASITPLGWFAVACLVITAFSTLSRAHRTTQNARGREGATLGLALWIVPALLLWPAAPWTHGVPLGQARNIVYFQYFGFALVACAAISRVLRGASSRRAVPALVTLAVFIASYGNVRADATVIAKNEREDRARVQLVGASKAGLFAAFPDGSTLIAPRATLDALGLPHAADISYIIYRHTRPHRRYVVVPEGSSSAKRGDWLLLLRPRAAISVALARWSLGTAARPLTNKAVGFTLSPEVRIQTTWIERRDRTPTRIRPLGDGFLLSVRQPCGSVPLAAPFAAPRPHLKWISGAYPKGPVGYSRGLPELNTLGDVTIYPQYFLGSHAVLQVTPSPCPPTAVVLGYIAVVGSAGTLTASGAGRTYTVQLAPTPPGGRPPSMSMTFPERSHAPIVITFRTTVPRGTFYARLFRYERSFPHTTRVMLQFAPVWELPSDAPPANRKGYP